MDCARNIITANFGGGTSATTAPLWQWDYGQLLCITGIEDLPAAFEVHFSTNRTGGVSTTAVGADGQVTIPNVLLTIGKNLNAWIYLSDAQGEGETEYSITIPVKSRPMPETYDAEVSGEFDDVVRQVNEYSQTAQTAADNAGAFASAAATSASEAAASASAAESAKTAAETAQGKAEGAQAAAETAAQTATEKALQSTQDAAQAAQSKADAESAARSAEAAQTGAESAKADAETAAQDAADSASAASASATSAAQAATSAAQSATAAAGSATTAQGAAQTATAKAGEASASASAAAASETAAQTAQQGAEAAETNAGQSASTATTKAGEAAQSASSAAQSKTDAEAAATRAETAAASLTVDSALSDTSTNPVQNKVITGELTDVKSAIEQIEDVTVTKTSEIVIENIFPNLTWSDGYMGKNGTIAGTGSNTYRHSQVYPVAPGDVVAFANSNLSFSFITAFDGQTIVEASGQQGGNSYAVPQNIDGVVISEYVSRGTAEINHTYTLVTYENALADEIDTLTDKSDAIEEVIVSHEYTDETTTNIYPTLTWTNGKYMHLNGGEVTSASFRYSNQIPVTEGDVISYANPAYKFRFVTAYSSANHAVESLGADSVNSYTVPAGIVFVVISDYISRGDAEIDLANVSIKTSVYVKPIPLGYMAEKGSLTSGDRLTLPYMQVKNKNRVVFNANIATLSSVKYVVGNASVEVNATNMIVTNGNGTATTVPHGLTIGKNITLLIETETEEYISHVRIASDGFTFDYSTKFYAPSANATQYVESVGSTLTECVLSWVSQNVNAPIWVFGDSYISWYDERWTYYLVQDGYDKNVMLNGFAGQGSRTAYRALDNLLKITTPKIVVWCLGMNDPDSDNAVSVTWKSIYDKILNLQKKYGFDLVLYTVPTTPTMNNTYKDAIIRTSGIRYIEADKAVRIDNAGHWVGNGTEYAALAGDNVHPTVYGAKILYNRILADLPEIMCNM